MFTIGMLLLKVMIVVALHLALFSAIFLLLLKVLYEIIDLIKCRTIIKSNEKEIDRKFNEIMGDDYDGK